MSSKKGDDNASSAHGGESSADYIISESGEPQLTSPPQTTKRKKSGFESVTDNIKEKVTGTAKSVKEGVSDALGKNDDADDRTKDLESAQVHQDEIGESSSDPKTGDNVREKNS
jgi:hypothetical protein